MKKKLLAAALIAAMALSLAACGNDAEETTADTTEDTAASSEEETSASTETADVVTAEEGKLVMATNAAFPPYEYIDGENFAGIDVEIAQAIADDLGLELEIEDIDFSSIITEVQSGKADLGLAGMTVTEERLQNVDFSTSYATGIQSIIVPEGTDITSVDDLYTKLDNGDDFIIGVQQSTTGHIYCEDDFGEEHVQAFTTGADAVTALNNGQVDCVIIDNNPAKAFVDANEGLSILDTSYTEEEYAACVSKDNTALLDAINATLEKLEADGTLQEIIDKYIPAE